MQNTFSQSGNDSKWFLTKIIFQNRYVAIETPSRPPPFLANAILNFHFDYWHTSLSESVDDIGRLWLDLVLLDFINFTSDNLQEPHLKLKGKRGFFPIAWKWPSVNVLEQRSGVDLLSHNIASVGLVLPSQSLTLKEYMHKSM